MNLLLAYLLVPPPHLPDSPHPVCPLPAAQPAPDTWELPPSGANESSVLFQDEKEIIFLFSVALFSHQRAHL